ncbi:MAG: protein-L-isoaspartate O-methyltransferase [Alphaproteobacteria bacterium]
MTDYATARQNMIDCQLRPNNVNDAAVLKAIAQTPREMFVPAASRPMAYVDEDVPVGAGRALLEPMVFARMLELAEIGPGDIVLDIACATGYSTAVLARLANTVVALEDSAELADAANELMTDLAIGNAVVVTGALTAGRPSDAPFDVILIEGAVAAIPPALIDQLGEGGRLVAILRPDDGPGRMTLVVKSAGAISQTAAYDAATPRLEAFTPAAGFVF